MITRLPGALLLFSILWLMVVPEVQAQRLTTKGTDFWLTFMQSRKDTNGLDLTLAITADVATTGTVSIPLAGWSQTFAIAAGSSSVIAVPPSLAVVLGSESIAGQGIHVSSNQPIALFALNYIGGSADATTILPTPVLGTDYRVMAFTPWVDDRAVPEEKHPSQFAVVGAANGTVVEITPTAATRGGQPAGVPFTVTVNAGEVYQVQSDSDLTGSRVRSTCRNCPPFALFGGAEFTLVGELGGRCGYADHLIEQLYPTSTWGMEYISLPLQTRRRGDIIRVLAAQDGTTITYDGNSPITLNAGEFSDTSLETPTYITADKPISVAQFSKGRQCDVVLESDPFMVLLNPLRQSLESMIFTTFTPTEISGYYLDVITKTSDVGLATLDGASITGSFTPLPTNPLYSFAQLSIDPGQHTLASSCGVSAICYAFGRSVSYGYSAGASLENIATTTIETECLCNGIIRLFAPLGMGPYRWSTGDTTRSIDINTTGTYSVQLLKQWGCETTTQPAPLPVILEEPGRIVLEPPTLEAAAGNFVSLNLHVISRRYSIGCLHDSATFSLRFNRTMLAPTYNDGANIIKDTIAGDDRIIKVRSAADTTVTVEMIAALGNVESTPIILDSLGWDNCPLLPQSQVLNTFRLSGICQEGGVRLFEANDSLYLKSARPDPATYVTEIEYGLVEPGWTEITLVNSTGERVQSPAAGLMLAGKYLLTLDVSQLPSGIYYCVLRTPSQIIQRPMRVVK